jgi:hypothetical protein
VRKLLALALLAFAGGGAVFVSIESETTALAGAPTVPTVSCASKAPMAALAAVALRMPAPSCMRVASTR